MTKSTFQISASILSLTLLFALAGCGPPKTQKAGNRVNPLASYEQAVEKHITALKAEPDSVILLTELGIAQYHLGRLEQALESFTHATDIERYPKASFYMGITKITMGDKAGGLNQLSMFQYTGKPEVTKAVRAKAKELKKHPAISNEETAEQLFTTWKEAVRSAN